VRVAILHPWLPQYRVSFFHRLREGASSRGFDIDVFHGSAPREWADRKDSRADASFIEVPTRSVRLGSNTVYRKDPGAILERGPYDLVILEHAVRNLETYELLARRVPVAFWGHGKTYTKAVAGLQERAKMRLALRGRWFFAYTEGGADTVVAAGYPRSQITVVQNAIDSSQLAQDVAAVTPEELEALHAQHGLQGMTALFVGGLDDSKRLPFLLEAARIIGNVHPGFRLLIAGDGAQRSLVEEAARGTGHVRYVGSAHGREKAALMRVADVLAMPGRVGLVAVDSFAAGRPIVTTDWPWHAPEFEYLTEDCAVVSRDDVADYAERLASTMLDEVRLGRLQAACRDLQPTFTLDHMAHRFIDGLDAYRAAHTGTSNQRG
jgi:glycosyltransferase involved in cell wall biosynthesis